MASSHPPAGSLTSPSHVCWWQETKEARPIYVQAHLISPRLHLPSSSSSSVPKSALKVSECSPAPAWRANLPRSPREEDSSTLAMAVAISGGLTSSLAMLEDIMRETQTSNDNSRDIQHAMDEQHRQLLSMKKRLQQVAQPLLVSRADEEATSKTAEVHSELGSCRSELGSCRSELSRCRRDLTLQLALSERISKELEDTQGVAEEMRVKLREKEEEMRVKLQEKEEEMRVKLQEKEEEMRVKLQEKEEEMRVKLQEKEEEIRVKLQEKEEFRELRLRLVDSKENSNSNLSESKRGGGRAA
ncbi:hypothetical protein GUITHDRAFT_121129 [Guillardia theta CCMP2712]|uniref:Uncharacterized protein n=1 Tax=Guillardia theta (strain CCMP2712) TaxID=905079 RepID=L1I9W3_GUITC|nr:hypothetical protein GUITHDRAFT_121129 [Guillardia theta CCMP2712]EKX32689.1 hypothetical protein GUITHDRAFT_121129 [Guillardia theta CCMP2712]|eukprot:XP_005819669.1 hypothetical protein GUITHDRAFT_121129 [Guillardia theta CCMP2712]